MKLCSNVCNRSRLVCVNFIEIGADLRSLLQNVKGLTFLGHTVVFHHPLSFSLQT